MNTDDQRASNINYITFVLILNCSRNPSSLTASVLISIKYIQGCSYFHWTTISTFRLDFWFKYYISNQSIGLLVAPWQSKLNGWSCAHLTLSSAWLDFSRVGEFDWTLSAPENLFDDWKQIYYLQSGSREQGVYTSGMFLRWLTHVYTLRM